MAQVFFPQMIGVLSLEVVPLGFAGCQVQADLPLLLLLEDIFVEKHNPLLAMAVEHITQEVRRLVDLRRGQRDIPPEGDASWVTLASLLLSVAMPQLECDPRIQALHIELIK